MKFEDFSSIRIGDELGVFENGEFYVAKVERLTRYFAVIRGLWYRRDNGFR